MTRRSHVFETMGTVVSLAFDDGEAARIDLERLHGTFAHFDDRYSLYKPDSELSRVARHELDLADASDELRAAYAAALDWRAATHGEFSPHRPDGIIDLSGIVKALAIERAGDELLDGGAVNWCLNVGGDVLVSGLDPVGEPWSIGIVDPQDRAALVTPVRIAAPRRACATSGSAERGDHIWTVGGSPSEFLQATVIADDIVTADVLATAIIAGGAPALDRACASWDIDVLTVDRAGGLRATPGFLHP